LLGKVIVRRLGAEKVLAGAVVETEAYLGASDPASKAYLGKKTATSKWMWAKAGTVFVYPVHGHWLFNVITARTNTPSAVLIRAVEPLAGVDIMRANRPVSEPRELTSGPGKFTRAFGICEKHLGLDVCDPKSELIISDAPRQPAKVEVASAHRIGVAQDLPEKLRFYVKGNVYVSRRSA
jgi:DNA-3-methyladenine glycosylase